MSKLRTLVTAVALSAGIALPALAADAPTGPFGGNIAGSVALYSDYKFRGISQTSNNPAIQGFLEYSVPVAGDAATVYASVWGSNVNFFGAQSLELDWTAGVRGTVMGFGYDLNVIYYTYPGGVNEIYYWEPGVKISYDLGFAVPYVGFRYSPDFQGGAAIANNLNSFSNTGHAEYYTAGVTVPLPFLTDYTPTAMAEINRQNIENNTLWGTPDYTTWTLGLSATAFTLTFGLQYVGSDLSRAECFGGTNVCDDRVIFSVTKTF